MYWNDLPREVAKLVDGKIAGHLGQPVIPEAVGRSGSDIRVYLEPGFNRYEYGVKTGQSFLDKIATEKPDIVPMMVVCRFIMGDEAPTNGNPDHATSITRYCEAIRAAGGEPMFYEMGWGKTEREAEGRQQGFCPQCRAPYSFTPKLAPGDLVLCGTSLGVLPMKPGSTVEVVVDGLNTSTNLWYGLHVPTGTSGLGDVEVRIEVTLY
jgi:hypothetical protein